MKMNFISYAIVLYIYISEVNSFACLKCKSVCSYPYNASDVFEKNCPPDHEYCITIQYANEDSTITTIRDCFRNNITETGFFICKGNACNHNDFVTVATTTASLELETTQIESTLSTTIVTELDTSTVNEIVTTVSTTEDTETISTTLATTDTSPNSITTMENFVKTCFGCKNNYCSYPYKETDIVELACKPGFKFCATFQLTHDDFETVTTSRFCTRACSEQASENNIMHCCQTDNCNRVDVLFPNFTSTIEALTTPQTLLTNSTALISETTIQSSNIITDTKTSITTRSTESILNTQFSSSDDSQTTVSIATPEVTSISDVTTPTAETHVKTCMGCINNLCSYPYNASEIVEISCKAETKYCAIFQITHDEFMTVTTTRFCTKTCTEQSSDDNALKCCQTDKCNAGDALIPPTTTTLTTTTTTTTTTKTSTIIDAITTTYEIPQTTTNTAFKLTVLHIVIYLCLLSSFIYLL